MDALKTVPGCSNDRLLTQMDNQSLKAVQNTCQYIAIHSITYKCIHLMDFTYSEVMFTLKSLSKNLAVVFDLYLFQNDLMVLAAMVRWIAAA